MTPVHSHTGREEVSEYLNDAYRSSSSNHKAQASTRMWIQPSQRDKLKRLSSEARTPVLQFLRDRPPLRRTLSRDSPYLEEAFQLAVDAIGEVHAEMCAALLIAQCVLMVQICLDSSTRQNPFSMPMGHLHQRSHAFQTQHMTSSILCHNACDTR